MNEKNPKDLTLFFFSIAACAFCIILFFITAYRSFGCENTARKFYYSLVTNHPDDAFDMLDVKTDAFVNKKIFAQNFGLSKEDIDNFDEDALKYVDFDSNIKSNGKRAVVYASSGKSGLGKYDSVSIDVIRNGRNFGIFPNWEVDASDIVAKNVSFVVPKGAALTINGKKITKEYIDSGAEDKDFDTYVIPQMLKSNYTTVCSVKGLEAASENKYISSDDEKITLAYGEPDEKILKELSDQTYADFTKVVNAAKEGVDFGALELLIPTDGDTTSMKKAYDKFKDSFAADSTQTGITSIEFTYIRVSPSFDGKEKLPTINTELVAQAVTTHNTDSFGADGFSSSTDYPQDIEIIASYVFEDGKWVLDTKKSELVPNLYVSNFSF